ncbi:hypothetical protein BOX15_Mlig012925g3 [Macrostomum lignano]|nr:hypothetical protein BOX15_Mlig031063g1 [Macrostomum lignano]PAA81807.1 hypothetical protein BOX15_Mlig012925g6 [Macrostomum lignano]PAA81817.1 hypothetical protein BOX15_Mlig012925g2 [Macrostomum lignano]PAA81829.1 hypothetical protein BOX15_Mlig012925g3 [Macrostomum lignano]
MASGVSVDPQVEEHFKAIKIGHRYRYIVFHIVNDSTITTERIVEESSYEDFVDSLPRNDCRYIIYDYAYTLEDGGKREKLLFIHWAPDVCKIRCKMIYASSKDAIKHKLRGVVEIQANDISEVAEDCIRDRLKAAGASGDK